MGRPIGSVNREKPFRDALRLEIWSGNEPRNLRRCRSKVRLDSYWPMQQPPSATVLHVG
jgi:hypothetical protein